MAKKDLVNAVKRTTKLLKSKGIDLNSSTIDASLERYDDFYKEWRKKISRPVYAKEYVEEEKKQIEMERSESVV